MWKRHQAKFVSYQRKPNATSSCSLTYKLDASLAPVAPFYLNARLFHTAFYSKQSKYELVTTLPLCIAIVSLIDRFQLMHYDVIMYPSPVDPFTVIIYKLGGWIIYIYVSLLLAALTVSNGSLTISLVTQWQWRERHTVVHCTYRHTCTVTQIKALIYMYKINRELTGDKIWWIPFYFTSHYYFTACHVSYGS